MLAAAQETLQVQGQGKVIQQANTLETLLADLIDYAGLFPPAGLDVRAALTNYRIYAQSRHAAALGRFVIDMPRIPDLLRSLRTTKEKLRISLISPPDFDPVLLSGLADQGLHIDSLEIKTDQPAQIDRLARSLPSPVTAYFEVPFTGSSDIFSAISDTGARAKLRMGGLVSEAFPSPAAVACMLETLIARRIPFKATAGLHHPLRSSHPFTYLPGSPSGLMHGFINLICATSILHSCGSAADATLALDEQDPDAFMLTADTIQWRAHVFTVDQLRTAREQCLISIGSCSFTEPLHDMEALGWRLA